MTNEGNDGVPRGRQKRGFLLSFEGIEGCGKSTQLRRLAKQLRSRGYLVVETREPGGSQISEQIRKVLLDLGNSGMDIHCELLLYLASRAQHVAETILPALDKGAIVLCDRFSDATMAYQGYGRGVGASPVARLNRFASAGTMPDLTIVLDVPVAIGLARKRRAGHLDRLDMEREAFHQTVRNGYLRIAKRDSRRVRVLDGTPPIEEVSAAINRLVDVRVSARKAKLTKVESHAV